jgi:hypothetical protein
MISGEYIKHFYERLTGQRQANAVYECRVPTDDEQEETDVPFSPPHEPDFGR